MNEHNENRGRTLQYVKAVNPLGVEMFSWSAQMLLWDDLDHIIVAIEKELPHLTIIKDYSNGDREIGEREWLKL